MYCHFRPASHWFQTGLGIPLVLLHFMTCQAFPRRNDYYKKQVMVGNLNQNIVQRLGILAEICIRIPT